MFGYVEHPYTGEQARENTEKYFGVVKKEKLKKSGPFSIMEPLQEGFTRSLWRICIHKLLHCEG